MKPARHPKASRGRRRGRAATVAQAFRLLSKTSPHHIRIWLMGRSALKPSFLHSLIPSSLIPFKQM
jgi:hypothetical protein